MGIASWRIIAGVMIGMIALSTLFNVIGSDTNAMSTCLALAPVLGGLHSVCSSSATDPVSAFTNNAKWAYGILIGLMCVLIRVVNPAFTQKA